MDDLDSIFDDIFSTPFIIETSKFKEVERFNDKYIQLLNLNRYPSKEVQKSLILHEHPFQYTTVNPEHVDYTFAVENFIYTHFIPPSTKLYINGVYFYSGKNSHNITSFFAYAAGYESLNELSCYPFKTSSITISLMTKNTAHNQRYNNMYQIKIKFETDKDGDKIVKSDFVLTAYISYTKTQAIQQIIYILSGIFNELRFEPILFTYIINFNYSDDQIENLVKILERNKNKFSHKFKIYAINKAYHESARRG
jgi:hypothetical protein